MRSWLVYSFALATLASTGVASAATKTFSAALSGDDETPAVDIDAVGTATFTVDDLAKTICGEITYDGLGEDPSAMHLHEGSPSTADGGIVFSVTVNASPVKVTFTNVASAKLDRLLSGETYFDIHTPTHEGGAIRGQLVEGGPPQTCTSVTVDAGEDAGHATTGGGWITPPDADLLSGPPPSGTSGTAPASKDDDGGCATSSSPCPNGGPTAALGAGFALAALSRRRRKRHRAR